jgi:hypothetical protein
MDLPIPTRRLIESAQSHTRKMPALALIHALALDRELRILQLDYPITYSAKGAVLGSEGITASLATETENHSRATLWRAETQRRQNRQSTAAEIGFNEATGSEIPALNLLYANLCLRNERIWMQFVNKYLTHRAIISNQEKGQFQIQLTPGGQGRFSRIQLATGTKPTIISDGPLVAVLMPIFNSEKTLEHAANSILNQTWRNLELWLIDDASTDRSLAIAQALKNKDPRVRVIELSQNGGPYIARNIGVGRSKGHYITVHDSDDWAFPTRLADQITALRLAPRAHVVIAQMLRMQEDGLIRRIQPTGWITGDGALRLCFPSKLFEREYFETRLGAWDTAKAGADLEMYQRIKTFDLESIHEIATPVMIQLDRVDSLTSSTELFNDERGISEWRRIYQLRWTRWHQQHTALPRLEFTEAAPRPLPPAM